MENVSAGQMRSCWSDNSDPDGMPVAHVLFRDALALHYVAHYAIEQKECRVLEQRSEGCRPGNLLVMVDPEHYGDVGDLVEGTLLPSGHGAYLGPYPAGDDGRLNDRRCLSRVGDEQGEVVLPDYRGGHLTDEMNIQSQLDETDREQLTDESGPAGSVDEHLATTEYRIDQCILGCRLHGHNRGAAPVQDVGQRIQITHRRLRPRPSSSP